MAAILIAMVTVGTITGCKIEQKTLAEKALRLAAMDYGYRSKTDFEWGPQQQRYYDLIMAGQLSVDMVDASTKYLSRHFANPIIARGFAELIVEAGVDFDQFGNVMSIEKMDIALVRAIATGFKAGLELQ